MEVLAEVVRSGFVESRHRGVIVRVDPTGEVVWSIGDPGAVIFPRSANKPLQALGMLRAGLPLDGELLALASASHSGEPFHLDAVREILALAGLDEADLQTPPSYPLDPKVHAAYIRAGGVRAPICMDCSGKHAAMLLTCVTNGWPTDTYLVPEHPLQVAITETFTDLTQGPPAVIGTDGCGAPLLATPLVQLARAVGRIAAGPPGSHEARARVRHDSPSRVRQRHGPPRARADAGVPRSRWRNGARRAFTSWRFPEVRHSRPRSRTVLNAPCMP